MCFGPDGIEIDLSKLGNIILVRGDNQDVQDEEERISSNGCGKTAISEVIVYTLFGKTIKHPKKLSHSDIINKKIGKKLRTEVIWDKYRVVRERKPNKLRLWESETHEWNDDTEITLGGMPATQEKIEELIGLTYETFVNTVVFTDNNSGSFLECDTVEKREIVENLLSLEKYRKFGESAKSHRKDYTDAIKIISSTYSHLIQEEAACKKRIELQKKSEKDWKNNKLNDLNLLIAKIKEKRRELESTDNGSALTRFQDAQDKITELNSELPELLEKQIKIKENIDKAKEKLDQIRDNKHYVISEKRNIEKEINDLKFKIKEHKKTLEDYDSLSAGGTCPVCHGHVDPQNFSDILSHCELEIKDCNSGIDKLQKELETKREKENLCDEAIKKILDASSNGETKLLEIARNITQNKKEIQELSKIEKPETLSSEKILEDQIQQLKERALALKSEIDGPSPYLQMLDQLNKELKDKSEEVKAKKIELEEAERELPYYEFWVRAFGDNGIRKFVIDGIIPALNSRIAYWLQFLIDGKIKLTFNNQLEEVIERNPADGDPFVYYAMSGGERRRLNLAVSQAFAYIMMINSGTSPSLTFLDEVTTNIDPIGVVGVYNMIVELSKEKQVFVTTHDHDLLEMLSGCDSINLLKKDGFTKIV